MASDGFRNRAAPLLIAGNPAGAHVQIDSTGISIYNASGVLVGKWIVPASVGILSADWGYLSHLVLPGTSDIPGGSSTKRMQIDPGVTPTPVRIFGPSPEGIQFEDIAAVADGIPILCGGRFTLDPTSAGNPVTLACSGDGFKLANILTGAPVTASNGNLSLLTGVKGQQSVTFPGGSNSQLVSVSFPVTLPSAPTAVFCSMPLLDLNAPCFAIGSYSTTGFQVIIQRRDGANINAQSLALSWTAVL